MVFFPAIGNEVSLFIAHFTNIRAPRSAASNLGLNS